MKRVAGAFPPIVHYGNSAIYTDGVAYSSTSIVPNVKSSHLTRRHSVYSGNGSKHPSQALTGQFADKPTRGQSICGLVNSTQATTAWLPRSDITNSDDHLHSFPFPHILSRPLFPTPLEVGPLIPDGGPGKHRKLPQRGMG